MGILDRIILTKEEYRQKKIDEKLIQTVRENSIENADKAISDGANINNVYSERTVEGVSIERTLLDDANSTEMRKFLVRKGALTYNEIRKNAEKLQVQKNIQYLKQQKGK